MEIFYHDLENITFPLNEVQPYGSDIVDYLAILLVESRLSFDEGIVNGEVLERKPLAYIIMERPFYITSSCGYIYEKGKEPGVIRKYLDQKEANRKLNNGSMTFDPSVSGRQDAHIIFFRSKGSLYMFLKEFHQEVEIPEELFIGEVW